MPARRPRNAIRPGVEGLDSRELLSLNIFDALKSVPGLLVSSLKHSSTTKHLSGVITGHYEVRQATPDTGSSVQLSASGQVTPLGQAKIAGSLTAPGFVRSAEATGTLVLSNAHGALTINLLGPAQVGSSALPNQFQYKTAGGTGAYRNVVDHGNLFFVRNSTSHAGPTSAPGSGAGAGVSSSGRFTLVLNSTS
jgi:hypothetical protein